MSEAQGPRDVCGHTVQIVEIDGNERLLVDGIRRAYVQSPNGYTLHQTRYTQPVKTLMEAGEALARRLAELEGQVSAENT